MRDLKNRVLRSPFKVLILQGFRDFGRLTSTFDSHYPLFFMPAGDLPEGIFMWLYSFTRSFMNGGMVMKPIIVDKTSCMGSEIVIIS